MHIDAICETNGKGWLLWAAQCPGAFARGATENEALAKLPGDVRRFLRWAGEPAGDITVTPGAPIESSLHTDDGEDAKPKGIHHQHSQIIGTLMPGQQPLHGWKKHDGSCEQCRCSIDGIPKGGRGTNTQGEIPDYAAAYGSDEAKNHDPKDVHVLFYGYHGAGY